jgi:NADPH2:quinone reductase
MRAIRIHETGGPEQLRTEDIPVPVPRPGEVRFRVEAAGVNFIDTYHRSGLYKVDLPHTLGSEAAGVVTALGEGVTTLAIGDRIGSARVTGAYADEATVAAAHAVRIPAAVDAKTAAALLLQGMTAHYLACDTFPLKSGDTALIHAGAGGVGLLLIQIAKRRGARVLTTVGTDEKAALARAAGADAVCVYTREDFTAAARAFTDGKGVDVAYDAVGRSTFDGTINSLRPRGMFVSFGNASGAVPPFAPLLLSQKGSLYFTRPTLTHYTQTVEELNARAGDLFRWVLAGELTVRIGATYPLAAAADAHRALEGRETTGKVLLLP